MPQVTKSAGVGSCDWAWPLGGTVEHTKKANRLEDGRVARRVRTGRAVAWSREEGLKMTRFGAPGTGWWQCY